MNILHVFGIILLLTVFAYASPSKQCKGKHFEGLEERIHIAPCGKTQCKLPRQHNVTVNFRFKPEHVVKSLMNEVHAYIGGIPLPFLGVHATSACANIFHEDGVTPAPCPLEPNKEYLYTNVFNVLPIYPLTSLNVKWSLNDGKKSVICFEVPAKIVMKKT